MQTAARMSMGRSLPSRNIDDLTKLRESEIMPGDRMHIRTAGGHVFERAVYVRECPADGGFLNPAGAQYDGVVIRDGNRTLTVLFGEMVECWPVSDQDFEC